MSTNSFNPADRHLTGQEEEKAAPRPAPRKLLVDPQTCIMPAEEVRIVERDEVVKAVPAVDIAWWDASETVHVEFADNLGEHDDGRELCVSVSAMPRTELLTLVRQIEPQQLQMYAENLLALAHRSAERQGKPLPAPGPRYYYAVCPATGVEIRVAFGDGKDDDTSALPPVLCAENGRALPCPACGESHGLVEITEAANAWLNENDDASDSAPDAQL